MQSMLETAKDYISAGFSIIPVGEDKRPKISWTKYQTSRMKSKEIGFYFDKPNVCLAVIGGEVSGNLEVMDFDDPEAFTPYIEMLGKECKGLFEKLVAHQTPSGGYHLLYRMEDIPKGNTVLARDSEKGVRIETRGKGGYALIPPSKGYSVLLDRTLKECPVLTSIEVEILHRVAGYFHELPEKGVELLPTPVVKRDPRSEGYPPGTIYNDEIDYSELLLSYGWHPNGRTTAGEQWTKPGSKGKCSGVLLDNSKNFYVWSTNVPPLEAEKSYSPFAFLTQMEYGNNFSLCAKELKKKQSPKTPTREYEAQPVDTRSVPVSQIMATEYPDLKWAVEGIIPEGLTLLAGSPKFGKSFLMLQLAYDMATGGKAWGIAQTTKAGVHYLALEDSERRIKRRIHSMEGYIDKYPDNLHIYTDFPRIDDGLIEGLNDILERDPTCGCIIIDTLQKVRSVQGKGVNGYQLDYEELGIIQKWAIQTGIPVIVVHHTRKGIVGAASDPFDEITGTRGIQGAVDTMIVCEKIRGESTATLHVRGREVEDNKYEMTFHRATCTWTMKMKSEAELDQGPFILSGWLREHDSITVIEACLPEVWNTNQQTARRKLDKLADEGKLIKKKDRGNKYIYYPEQIMIGVSHADKLKAVKESQESHEVSEDKESEGLPARSEDEVWG